MQLAHLSQSPAPTPITPVVQHRSRELRAMKRALASAPLGPMAVLALTSAIVAIEEEMAQTGVD